jgi:hypothetical protein
MRNPHAPPKDSCKEIENGGAGLVLFPTSTVAGLRFRAGVTGEYELMSWLRVGNCDGAVSRFLQREIPRIAKQLNEAKVDLRLHRDTGISVADLLKVSNQLRRKPNVRVPSYPKSGREQVS